MRKLHVYADELGDAGPFSEHSPIYSLSLLFIDESADRGNNLRLLESAIRKYGGNHFIHCGNLIRGEEPYEGVLRESRQALFYALVSYAGGIDFFFQGREGAENRIHLACVFGTGTFGKGSENPSRQCFFVR